MHWISIGFLAILEITLKNNFLVAGNHLMDYPGLNMVLKNILKEVDIFIIGLGWISGSIIFYVIQQNPCFQTITSIISEILKVVA